MTWRSIDAGLRGEYWTKAIAYFTGSPLLTQEVMEQFQACLHVHANYLMEKHDIMRRMSNWSILEDHGLYLIGMYFAEYGKTNRYIKTALDHLEIEARLQIMPDGTQGEQSPMYHNEVFHSFLDVIWYGRKINIAVHWKIVSKTDLRTSAQ